MQLAGDQCQMPPLLYAPKIVKQIKIQIIAKAIINQPNGDENNPPHLLLHQHQGKKLFKTVMPILHTQKTSA